MNVLWKFHTTPSIAKKLNFNSSMIKKPCVCVCVCVCVCIYIVTCRVVHVTIMTGSSSDDWILLALWLQPLSITLNHNTIADSTHFTITLHTNLLCPNLHSKFTAVAPSHISLVPIRFSKCTYTALCHYTAAHLKSSDHTLSLHRLTSSCGYLPPPTTRTLNCTTAHVSLPISKSPHPESK
jgi:hypothetical protein